MDSRLLISLDVLEFIKRLPRTTRAGLRNTISRIVQITVVGDYALTYWIDDADRQVKILDIHSADR